jgi:hypothetical protein
LLSSDLVVQAETAFALLEAGQVRRT